MKLMFRRLDAALLLISAVVIKGEGDPWETALIGIMLVFLLGWVLDWVIEMRLKRQREKHARWREEIEERDDLFGHLMDISEDFDKWKRWIKES